MARIEPGPLALQASASSITPWPLCQSLTSYIQTFNNSQKNKFSIKSQVATKTKKTFFFESFSHFFSSSLKNCCSRFSGDFLLTKTIFFLGNSVWGRKFIWWKMIIWPVWVNPGLSVLCVYQKLLFTITLVSSPLMVLCAEEVIVRDDQLLSLPGYQAPVMKASQCGNERQEDLAGGKWVVKKGRGN